MKSSDQGRTDTAAAPRCRAVRDHAATTEVLVRPPGRRYQQGPHPTPWRHWWTADRDMAAFGWALMTWLSASRARPGQDRNRCERHIEAADRRNGSRTRSTFCG